MLSTVGRDILGTGDYPSGPEGPAVNWITSLRWQPALQVLLQVLLQGQGQG